MRKHWADGLPFWKAKVVYEFLTRLADKRANRGLFVLRTAFAMPRTILRFDVIEVRD